MSNEDNNSSSWGSWGSWISSTVNNVVDKSSQIVQDLTSGVEEETNDNSNDNNSNSNSSKGKLKLYRTDEDIKEDEEKQKQDIDFEDKIIQSTTGVIVDTTSFLTSMINQGVDKIQNIDINNIKLQAENVGKQAKDLSSSFVTQTVDIIDHTKELLVPESQINNNINDNNDNNNIKQPIIHSFSFYFDDNLGNVHIQALELLSTECTMKLQDFQRKCDQIL